jgi:polar amino acid transport system substrate-binding protein
MIVSAISCRPAAQCLVNFGIAVLMTLPAFAQTTLETIKQENQIRVGVANERPYGYLTAEGRLTGEGPEIARKILAEIDPDIRLEGVVSEFQFLIDDIQAGRFDMIAAGMFITLRRCEEVAFSDPTYKIGEALVVKAGNPHGLTDLESIARQPDTRLAVLAGAVEYEYAYEAGMLDPDRNMLVADYQEGLVELRAGRVDAIAMTALTAYFLTDDEPGVEATSQFFPVIDGEPVAGYGAFAFRKEDKDLLDAFNEHLATFIGSHEHLETVKEFGFTPDMIPDKTAEQLCKG